MVEEHTAGIDYDNGTVIALTPEACYGLKKAGISYKIIEDYYNGKNLKADEDKFFYEQLEWLKEIDKLIKNNVKPCRENDINLATAHFYQMKFFIDSVILQFRIFREAIFNLKPSEVIYVCAKRGNGLEHNIYDLFNNNRRPFCEACNLVCKKYEIPFSVRHGSVKKGSSSPDLLVKKQLKTFLKKIHCKSVYYFFKYYKLAKLLKRYKENGHLNLLFLHAGWLGIDLIIKKCIGSGFKVFFRDGKKIVLISGILQRDVLDLGHFDADQRREIADSCISAFNDMMEKNKVIDWINDKCGLNVSSLVTGYLRHFMEKICVDNILEFLLLKEFYEKEGIDFVIARSSSEEDSISTFLAAAGSKKRACFQHGIMHEAKEPAFTELGLVDYYFTMDGISERFFKSILQSGYASECTVLQSEHYLKAISERWEDVKRPKHTIMYVPTKIFTGFNMLNINFYTLPWYYEFQKAVIDYFASVSNKNFIYKHAVGQGWQDSSLLLYMKDKQYSNIYIEKRPLAKCLGKAERIILDYPSTGFFEAAVSGIPAMSLCHDTFKINPEIKKFFKDSIQFFSTIPEAIEKIDNFIVREGRDFVFDVPLAEQGDAVNYLQYIKSQKEGLFTAQQDSRTAKKISI